MENICVSIWFIELPSTHQIIGYNFVYDDMFRLTRVINQVMFRTFERIKWPCILGSQEAYTIYTINIQLLFEGAVVVCF